VLDLSVRNRSRQLHIVAVQSGIIAQDELANKAFRGLGTSRAFTDVLTSHIARFVT